MTAAKTSTTRSLSPVRRFVKLVDEYYDQSFHRFPIAGSVAGRHEFDHALGRADPATWERQAGLVEKTLAAVEDLPPQDFEASRMLDRRAFLAHLRQERLELVELTRWRNDPQLHLFAAAEAIHDMVVRHSEDLSPVAEAILSRLRKIPRFLDQAAECIHRPVPLWKQLTVSAAPAVGGMFKSLAGPLAAVTGKSPAMLAGVTRRAEQAAQDYARVVNRARPAAEGSFALGAERFTALMRERLGLALSPREAVAFARREAERLAEALREEARRFHPRNSPAEILDQAARQWKPRGKDLLEAYTRMTQRMRERFEKADWLTFPQGDRLLVKPVPEFMRDQFPTAAYSSPGPLDPDQTGIFWVNDLSAAATTERQRAGEVAQHFGLELTCAHEAYPGHHLQYIHQNRHPSLARKMAHHAIYYEGWTLWCEQMTADLPRRRADNPHLRLIQLHDALWRAWRIVIDVGLQTGELTFEGACRVLQREVGFTAARARGDVNWYTSHPTVPMSYLLGKMEVLRLKHDRVDRGGMTLREFNDWILSFGAIPWRWIEQSGL